MHLPRQLRRRVAALCAVGLGVGVVPLVAAPTAQAATSELFFSEYVEGTSNNKALEIYNGTGAAIDLPTAGYNVQIFFNGAATAGLTINLTGTVADGDVFVLAQSAAAAAILAQADQTNDAGWFNGDDAVVLRKGSTVVDSFGQIGVDPGTEWGTGLVSTADNTLRRKASVVAGDTNATDAFDPSGQWDGFATDVFDGLGAHTIAAGDAAPSVASTVPVGGATGVAADANLSVTFSEPVNVTGDWVTLSCVTSGVVATTVTGGPTTFTIDPAANLAAGEECTLTVLAANVTDQDADDPPDTMAANHVTTFTVFINQCDLPYTPIPQIQGSGDTVALTGTRTTQGIVVADYEGASPMLRGFYLQDPAGDGDPATSDGIFVFEGSNADTVAVGDLVRVTGNAGENQGQSQISVGSIVTCGTGTVAPTPISFPVASPTFLERYEGMLVSIPEAMTVTEHFQLGRFGQVVVSSEGRLQQPTNVVAPGDEALVLQAANNNRKLIIDDGSQVQNPDPIVWGRNGQPLSASNTLRGGDTVTGAVGVLTYTWAGNSASGNAYRLRPIGALGGTAQFEAVNERPAAAPQVGGAVQVAAMNLLNFFNTFDGLPDRVNNCTNGVGGAATDCRGADTAAEFDRQWPKTVAAIRGLGAAVVGVNEIENDGYGADSAIAFLVDRLNEADGPGTWTYLDVDARTGQTNALGTDAIKVGMIYQPALVTPVGDTAALNSVEFVNGGDSGPRSRPALAQAFRDPSTGGIFSVVVNHLKSKGSACDDPAENDGQGNCTVVRTNSAKALAAWLATDPTGTGDDDVLIMGDLNSYAKEDPVATLEKSGYTNLVAERIGSTAYSYVFDGQWGYLDHALGSASIDSQVTGVGEWHINADEPSVLDYNTDFKTANLQSVLYAPDQFRISDHDPVIVGLTLTNNSTEFVTGGGWINAPSSGGVVAGKGEFQLSAKYVGSDPLTGSVEYSVDSGFTVASTSLDWLVVNGSEARLVGSATVNGDPGYRFEVTAVDGGKRADTFRIVVRDATGVVYDSGAQSVKGQLWVHE